MLKAKIKKLRDNAQIPKRGSEEAAGFDLYAATDYDIQIQPHQTVMIGTGVAITPPKGYFGAIFARSGLATKRCVRPANCVGVCDYDYNGEYIVACHNDSDKIVEINAGERIAQLVFLPYQDVDFDVVDELKPTKRGNGGFGSTGNV